jgi:hypothetical protein
LLQFVYYQLTVDDSETDKLLGIEQDVQNDLDVRERMFRLAAGPNDIDIANDQIGNTKSRV